MPRIPSPPPPLSPSPSSTLKHRPHLAPLHLPTLPSARPQPKRWHSLQSRHLDQRAYDRADRATRAAQAEEGEFVAPPHEEEGVGSDERVEAWRAGVWTPLSSLPDAHGAAGEQEEHDALHDPSLFGGGEEHEGEGVPESPSALEVDFGRGRRGKRERERERGRRDREREASAARSVASSVGMTRKLLSSSGGMKGEASVQVQAKAIASSPPGAVVAPQTPPRSASLAHSAAASPSHKSHHAHARGGSTASDQLLKSLQSTSPSSPLSSPAQASPHRRLPLRPANKRRYSSVTTTPVNESEGAEALASAPPLARAKSHHHDRAPFRYGSVAALSKYLEQGRRSSLPATPQHADSAPETPAEPRDIGALDVAAAAGDGNGVVDLASTSFFGSLSTHLPSVPSFIPHPHLLPFQHPPSPVPFSQPSPAAAPAPLSTNADSPSSAASPATRYVAWSSIRALNVRFRPNGSGSGGGNGSGITTDSSSSSTGGGSDSSLGLNHFVLGLQDLASGGSRAWDPRLLSPLGASSSSAEEEKLSLVGSGGYESWPTIRTEVGAPPRVEVVFEGGERRVCEVGGMGAEEIMRAVLSIPV
ncbi:hypothetical protein JCM6882_005088 [Rhodosporidiobolus microsporus]